MYDFYTTMAINSAFGAGVKSVSVHHRCMHGSHEVRIKEKNQIIHLALCVECHISKQEVWVTQEMPNEN